MELSFHYALLRVALTDALAPGHACAACFFILRPGAGIRVNHGIGAWGDDNVWIHHPICVGYSTLSIQSCRLPRAIHSAVGSSQANRSWRRHSFRIIPVISQYFCNQPRGLSCERSRYGRLVFDTIQAPDLEELFYSGEVRCARGSRYRRSY